MLSMLERSGTEVGNTPDFWAERRRIMAPPAGIGPATIRLVVERSIPLSYEGVEGQNTHMQYCISGSRYV